MEKILDKIIPALISIVTGTIANLLTDYLRKSIAKKKRKVNKKKKYKDDS